MENRSQGDAVGKEKEMLLLAGGVAMLIVGGGLLLASPPVRRLMKSASLDAGTLFSGLMPDIERYFRLRSM
jgi:hypothetical protein